MIPECKEIMFVENPEDGGFYGMIEAANKWFDANKDAVKDLHGNYGAIGDKNSPYGYHRYICLHYRDRDAEGGGEVDPPVCNHENRVEVVVTEPTCVDEGVTNILCGLCNELLEVLHPAALGHDMPAEWTIRTEPTVDTEGEQFKKCSRCDYEETEVIPKIVPPAITMSDIPELKVGNLFVDNQYGAVEDFDPTGLPSVDFTLTKGDKEYSNVRVAVDADVNTKAHVQAIAYDTNNNAYNILESGWGPVDGFPIADATTKVYIVADQAGTYTATANLIDVTTSEVLATADMSITVNPMTGDVQFSNGDANDIATINVPGMTVTASDDGETVTFVGEVAKSDLTGLTELPADDPAYNWAEDVAFTYAYFKLPEGANYVNFGDQITVPSNGLIPLDNKTTDGQVVEINSDRYYKMPIQFAHKTTGLDWALSVGANNPDNIVDYEFTVGSVTDNVYTAALTYKLTLDYSKLTIKAE